jgi:hypothetical protein
MPTYPSTNIPYVFLFLFTHSTSFSLRLPFSLSSAFSYFLPSLPTFSDGRPVDDTEKTTVVTPRSKMKLGADTKKEKGRLWMAYDQAEEDALLASLQRKKAKKGPQPSDG